jgi:2-dehydropantoate 2-reductase
VSRKRGDAEIKRAVVFGAGAVGSYLGAKLSSRLPVRLVGRRPHVEAIRRDGLRVSGLDSLTARPEASERLGEVPPGTLVLLTVKLYDLEAAAEELSRALSGACTVVVAMNGLHPERALREQLGDKAEVIRAVAMLGATLEGPGRVSYWGGGLELEPSGASEALAELLCSAGIDARVAGSFDELVWRKFAVNCVWNPLTAVLGVRNSLIAAEELTALRGRVIAECAAVARAEGVCLPADFAESTDRALAGSENVSSMLQDVIRRPRTENEHISGELVRTARSHGRQVPANELLLELVRFIESRSPSERPFSALAAQLLEKSQ